MAPESVPGFADVSVIVAAYQAAGTIGRTLRSIAAQTLKPREVVVVDDGSTDGTSRAAEAEAPNMKGIRLRVIRTDENRGAGWARNRAIEESKEPFLAFLDADDEWLPEKLSRTMPYMKGGEYRLVAHDYLTGDGDNTIHHDCVQRFRENGDSFVNLYRKGYVASSSVVTRRETVLAAGGYDPTLPNAQDFDLWLAMTRDPDDRFLVFGEALLHYHPSPGGIMSHTARRLDCCLRIARRYIPDLKRRSGSALMSLWYRVTALHLEAIRAYLEKGNILAVGWTLTALPVHLAALTFFFFFRNPRPRGSFLNTGIAGRTAGDT